MPPRLPHDSRLALLRPPAHEVKAQFIERFTRFVDWPGGTLPDKGPFVVCLVGESALADAFARVAGRREIKNLPTLVRRIADPKRVLTGCHLVYLAGDQEGELGRLLARLRRSPVLTVSDSPGFAAAGVLINLFVDQTSRVRFEINMQSVARSPLKFSARLLRLATPIAAR